MNRLAFLFTLLFVASGASAQTPDNISAPTPSAIIFRESLSLTADDRTILTSFIGHAVAFAKKQTAETVKDRCLKSPEMFAWVDFRNLQCLTIAYELTGDTTYLDTLRDCFRLYRAAMDTGPDEYLGWYGSPIKDRIPKDNPDIRIDEIQMNFRAISVLAKWVTLARANPAYAEANSAVIADTLSLIEKHLLPKWDARGFYHDLGRRGGIYGGLDYPLHTGKNSLSFEKLSIMVDGLLALHRATGNPSHLRRALEIGAWFKNCLSLQYPDGHYEWMSWCPSGPGDVSAAKPDAWTIGWIAPDPKGEWYVASLSIALNLYQHGLLFTDEDLRRFVRTQKEQCWNGNLDAPGYRTVAGESSTQNSHVSGRFLSYQISHYDPVLTRLAFHGPHEAEALKNAPSGWLGGTNAQDYVREKFIMAPLVRIQLRPYAAFGERFLASPENRALHDRLAFNVEPPGAVTPLKPSQTEFLKITGK